MPTCIKCKQKRGRDNRTKNAELGLCNICCVIYHPDVYGKWALAVLMKAKSQYPERFAKVMQYVEQRRDSNQIIWW